MAHATTGVRVALAAILRAQTAAVAAAWPRAARGDAGAIHRVRTASRRLRETLPLVSAVVPRGGAERARRETRRLTRALGVVRELDVALEVLAEGIGGRSWTGPDAARVRRALLAERARARRVLRTRLRALDRDEWVARLDDVVARIDAADLTESPEAVLARRVRRRAAVLRDVVRTAGTLYAPEALHHVRIAAKKLRYSLELARDVTGAPVGSLLASLVAVQDRLGRFHDLHVLFDRVRSMDWPGGSRRGGNSRAALEAVLDRECREQHAAYLAGRDRLMAAAQAAATALSAPVRDRRPPMRMRLMAHPDRALKPAAGGS